MSLDLMSGGHLEVFTLASVSRVTLYRVQSLS